MLARDTAIDSVFMLKTDQVIAVEIEKLGSSFIRGQVFLVKFQANLAGIVVCRIRIIHRNSKEPIAAKLRSQGGAYIRREGCNAALTRQIVSYEGNTEATD